MKGPLLICLKIFTCQWLPSLQMHLHFLKKYLNTHHTCIHYWINFMYLVIISSRISNFILSKVIYWTMSRRSQHVSPALKKRISHSRDFHHWNMSWLNGNENKNKYDFFKVLLSCISEKFKVSKWSLGLLKVVQFVHWKKNPIANNVVKVWNNIRIKLTILCNVKKSDTVEKNQFWQEIKKIRVKK